MLSDLKTLWFHITYFHYRILNGENSFNVALFRAKMKVQNWICDVTANSYNRASPELTTLERERQVVPEMKRNSQYDKKWPSGGEEKLKKRTLMLYKEKKSTTKKNCFTYKEKRWLKEKGMISFFPPLKTNEHLVSTVQISELSKRWEQSRWFNSAPITRIRGKGAWNWCKNNKDDAPTLSQPSWAVFWPLKTWN